MGFLQKLLGGMPGLDDHGVEAAGPAEVHDHDHEHEHGDAEHSHDDPASDDANA